jgi:hypothetical protein
MLLQWSWRETSRRHPVLIYGLTCMQKRMSLDCNVGRAILPLHTDLHSCALFRGRGVSVEDSRARRVPHTADPSVANLNILTTDYLLQFVGTTGISDLDKQFRASLQSFSDCGELTRAIKILACPELRQLGIISLFFLFRMQLHGIWHVVQRRNNNSNRHFRRSEELISASGGPRRKLPIDAVFILSFLGAVLE